MNTYTEVPTFNEVMALTSTVSSSTAFSDVECRGLYNALRWLTPADTFLEIGCQLGRSSSIALQLQKALGFQSIHCDPYTDQPDFHQQWLEMAAATGAEYTLLKMNSALIPFVSPLPEPTIIFIDGDHTYPVVRGDMDMAVEILLHDHDSLILTHDYGNPGLPDVTRAADEVEALGKVWRMALYDSLLVWGWA